MVDSFDDEDEAVLDNSSSDSSPNRVSRMVFYIIVSRLVLLLIMSLLNAKTERVQWLLLRGELRRRRE